MTDKTPLIHAAVSVAIQIAVGLLLGDWLSGGIAACIWWAARAHTQAEYRLAVGLAYGSGGFFNGTIRDITYYSRRLTNAELQTLSAQ